MYIKEAAEIIKNGGLVLFPTETVYGIGANALNDEAVKKIFIAKGRAQDNPLILHISDMDMLSQIVDIAIIEGVEAKGIGLAIMNRLIRACEHDYIEV